LATPQNGLYTSLYKGFGPEDMKSTLPTNATARVTYRNTSNRTGSIMKDNSVMDEGEFDKTIGP